MMAGRAGPHATHPDTSRHIILLRSVRVTAGTTGDGKDTGDKTTTGNGGSDGTQTDDANNATPDDANADKVTLTITTTGNTGTQDTDTFTLWRIGTYGTTPDDDYKARDLTVTATSKATATLVRDAMQAADKDHTPTDGTDPVAALWTRWADPDNTTDPPARALTDAIGDRLDQHKDDKDKATATKPEATHTGAGTLDVTPGWYLVRDAKGTSHLAGTLTGTTANPTDVKLGELTIKTTDTTTGTDGTDADRQAEADAQAQSDAANAAEADAADTDAQAQARQDADTLTAPRQDGTQGATTSTQSNTDGTPSPLSSQSLNTDGTAKTDTNNDAGTATPGASPSTQELRDDPTRDIATPPRPRNPRNSPTPSSRCPSRPTAAPCPAAPTRSTASACTTPPTRTARTAPA